MKSLRPRLFLGSVVVVVALASILATPANAQVATATFDGTYSSPSAGESGTVSIVFSANGTQRSFAATFTGTLLGATNPSLSLMATLDAFGGATFMTTGDPVFGDTTIFVDNLGNVVWTTTNVVEPFTGTGNFTTTDLNDPNNTLTLNFVGTNPPMNTGSLTATRVMGVPAVPLLLLALFLGALLVIGSRLLPRKTPAAVPAA